MENIMSQQMLDLVRHATLAANGHNTQPWKFVIRENVIEIHADYSRRLPVVDPNDRALWISLGCALENLLIAARASGYKAVATYPGTSNLIRVQLALDTTQPSPLFDAIPLRQTTRSEYDGRPVRAIDLEKLQGIPLEPGISLHFFTSREEKETILEYVKLGNLHQYADKLFVEELITWVRFNRKEALSTLDGLYARCSGNPEIPHWLGKKFVSGTSPKQQADSDSRKLRSSAGLIVIASETDGKDAWVRTGQVYERMALTMTTLNIKSGFLNQPIEVAEIRTTFRSAIGLDAYLPQLLVRYGYADAMPRSLRRTVEQVSLYT
jgi:hypothetical protein